MIKTMKPKQIVPYPVESLFPGIHAEMPDLARREAEQFLEFGARDGGVDLANPEVRANLLGRKPFVSFQLRALPATIERRLAALPENWERLAQFEAEATAIEVAVNEHYALPAQFSAMIVENKEVWISPL